MRSQGEDFSLQTEIVLITGSKSIYEVDLKMKLAQKFTL